MTRWAITRGVAIIAAQVVIIGLGVALGTLGAQRTMTRVLTLPGVHNVVVLGDSVPAGSACRCAPFGDLVAEALRERQHRPVRDVNLAVGGLTSQELVYQLRQPKVESALRSADIAIVTIGANDFDSRDVNSASCAKRLACYQTALVAFRSNLSAALNRLHALMIRTGSRVLVTGYWNVFLDGKVAAGHGRTYQVVSDALTRAVNAIVQQVSAADSASFVDLYAPFKGDGDRDDTNLLAADGDHPNGAGQALIAEAVEWSLASQ